MLLLSLDNIYSCGKKPGMPIILTPWIGNNCDTWPWYLSFNVYHKNVFF